MRHGFSEWDGTQDPLGEADDFLFDRISEDVFHGWDVESAVRRLLGAGWNDAAGRPFGGLEEMMEQLRRQRQRRLERYNLGTVFDDLTERIDGVVRLEREGMRNRLADATGSPANQLLKRVVQQREQQLTDLPAEPSGAVKALRDYEFLDAGAEQAFARLLEEIRQRITDTYVSQMASQMRGTSPADLARLRAMARDLNALVRKKLEGAPPSQLQADYERFRREYADFYPNAPAGFDEFLEQLQQQMARMDSLMQSLPDDVRRELEDLAAQTFGDSALQADLGELMASLELLSPRSRLGSRYSFVGDESVTLDGAMQLMDGLQSMEELERALRDVYRGDAVGERTRDQVRDLLGDEALQNLDRITEMTRRLSERGLVERTDDGLRLTARGMRRIGHKALGDIFTHLARDRMGDHGVDRHGSGGERSDTSRPYTFGDPFDLDVAQTVMNGVHRRGHGGDDQRQIHPADFSVYQTDTQTRAATVLMLDLSRSMPLRGYFYAAKKVALALDSLIRTQYPRDSLHIVGFSDYAREIPQAALPQLSVNEYVYGTNLQHGLILARRLLARDRAANKQIIIVSDGEPTAHLEGGRAVFFYPPLPETFEKTLIEVRRCTREDIVINTFMLESNRHLVEFVNRMTRLNRGRAFFISPDRLGDYVLVDFVKTRRGRAA